MVVFGYAAVGLFVFDWWKCVCSKMFLLESNVEKLRIFVYNILYYCVCQKGAAYDETESQNRLSCSRDGFMCYFFTRFGEV